MNKFFVTRATISGRRWFRQLCFSLLAVGWGWIAAAKSDLSIPKKKAVARLGGEVIYEEDLPAPIFAQLREAREREYVVTVKAIQELARQRLLMAEAKRRGTTAEELLNEEADKMVGNPTPGEADAFYLAQGDHSRPFDEVKDVLVQDLKRAQIQARRDAFLNSLQQQSGLTILLDRPRAVISYDSERLKGSGAAPVMIVEFSDFQCPFCRQAESTLKQLADKYQGKVSLAYRDFPLTERHPRAQLAAEAARCAGEQAKFWEYHDLLFDSPNRNERADLLRFAQNLGLDEKRFDSCLSSGKYKPQIEQDVQDGMRVGVSATPAFFINGIFSTRCATCQRI